MWATTQFHAARALFREKGTAIPEGRAKRLGQGKHKVPVRHVMDDMLFEKFGPQNGALGRTRRAETALLAGKCDEILYAARITPNAREATLGKAAPEEPLDCFRDNRPQRSE
jgi:hypothetical protein